MMLQGSLGTTTIQQSSKTHRNYFYSINFQELTNGPGQNRKYTVKYDKNNGLIKASRSANDKSEIAAISPFVDPIGLLYQVRHLDQTKKRFIIPMIGKNVIIEKITQLEIDTALGKKLSNVYKIHPGKNLLYVDTEKPHYILAMTQFIGNKFLDSFIVKTETLKDKKRRPNKGRRRPRRRFPKSKRVNKAHTKAS